MNNLTRFSLRLIVVCALLNGSWVNASVLLSNWEGSGASGFGSLAMDRNDDGSSQEIFFSDYNLNFNSGVNFFGTSYDSFFINNNGNISFSGSVSAFTPESFPSSSVPMIAPFWGDVDTRCESCGEIYIGAANPDTVVVTWDQVGFYFQDSSLTNTFQLVLIDREDTGEGNFDVEFRYDDINWTTGDASEGTNGLGGTPAQAGYDAGDGVNFFTVPGSQTADIVDIDTDASNTNTPGIWKFAIRNGQLPGSDPDNPLLPIIDPETPDEFVFEFEIIDPETPIFIDPEVAIGYDYIVNSGPSMTSVILPEGFDDNMFSLYLWDDLLGDWFDSGEVLMGGQQYIFNDLIGEASLDMFRILGIDTGEMVDPTDPTVFVTGLTFDSQGTVNINQNAVTQNVGGPGPVNDVPAPISFWLFSLGLGFVVLRKSK